MRKLFVASICLLLFYFGNSQKLTFTKADVIPIDFNESLVQLEIINGTEPYDYTWEGPNGIFTHEEVLTTLIPGKYCVSITDGKCKQLDTCFQVEHKTRLESIETHQFNSTSANTEISGLFEVGIYPNPTSGEITLNVENQKYSSLHIDIIDIQNRLIMRRSIEAFEGLGTQRFDLSNYSSGTYLVNICSPEYGCLSTHKVVKIQE